MLTKHHYKNINTAHPLISKEIPYVTVMPVLTYLAGLGS